eukprot:gene7572-8370_t
MSSSYTITSKDIDCSLFSAENHGKLKTSFPEVDDTTIARYLIARNNDLERAKEFLGKALQWRSRRWPVLKEECVNALKKGVLFVHGHDKEGHPILHVNPYLHDVNTRDIEETAKAAMWWMEYAISQLPEDKSKFTILINRSGGGNGDIEFSRHFSKLFQDQHPERLHRAIIYPSGLIFWGIFNVVKWFFDPVTRNKAAPVLYLSGVQEFIDDEHIPANMGGKSTFEFNLDDYQDPYPPEFVERVRAQRAVPSASTKTFFQPEQDADVGNYDAP